VVDEDAFRGVGGQSVRDLSIKSSHLSDEHLAALLPLVKLRSLNIALNRKVTSVDRLLDALPSLETLDASGDGVVSLGRDGCVSATLRVCQGGFYCSLGADALGGRTAVEGHRRHQ